MFQRKSVPLSEVTLVAILPNMGYFRIPDTLTTEKAVFDEK